MGTETGDAATLKAKLDANIKDTEEAEEKAVAARRRVRAARTLLEEEEQMAAALEKAAVAARQLVPGSSSSTVHTSSSSSSYEETVVTGLHLQAVGCPQRPLPREHRPRLHLHRLHQLRDLMMMVLERYALLDHVNSGVASSTDPRWRRMDSVVLNWISNSITPELHQVVQECGATVHHLWLAIENQFLGNREQRTLHLDAAFRNFV
jgi:hypothetical protein